MSEKKVNRMIIISIIVTVLMSSLFILEPGFFENNNKPMSYKIIVFISNILLIIGVLYGYITNKFHIIRLTLALVPLPLALFVLPAGIIKYNFELYYTILIATLSLVVTTNKINQTFLRQGE